MPSLGYYTIISGLVILLGFGREIAISSHFGISSELDVYVAVTCFHSFFGVQVGNATESVFVSKAGILTSPIRILTQLVRFLKELTFFNLITIPLILLFSGKILYAIVPGFSESQIEQGQTILNLIILSTIAANLSGAFRGALNIQKLFYPGFIAGGIVSFSIILAVILLEKKLGIFAIASGLVAGHIVVLAVYMLTCHRIWHSHSSACKDTRPLHDMPSLSKAVGVLLISEILYQLFGVTQKGFSSEIASGTIAALAYTEILVAVPNALFMIPLSTILFPRLAKAFSTQYQEGNRILLRYGSGMFAASLVLAVVIAVFSELIVSTVFVRGRFTLEDSFRTAELLRVIILTLPFLSIATILRYALYSMSVYKAAIYSNGLMCVMLVGMGLLLIPRHGAIGLAWATVAGMGAQVISMVVMIILKSKRVDAKKDL